MSQTPTAKINVEWTTSEGRVVKHSIEFLVPPSGTDLTPFREAFARLGEELEAKFVNW